MQLPYADRLRVDESKITGYLLSEMNSRGKAAFFLRLGFTPERWEVLAEALKVQARNNAVVSAIDSPHGARYCVDGDLETPDNRRPHPRVRTVWILAKKSQTPRLITAHPV